MIGDSAGVRLYRCEMVERIGLGWLDRASPRRRGAQKRKRAVTAVSSSRWAGAITRAVEDQYQLGIRGLATEVRGIGAPRWRCSSSGARSRAGELAPVPG